MRRYLDVCASGSEPDVYGRTVAQRQEWPERRCGSGERSEAGLSSDRLVSLLNAADVLLHPVLLLLLLLTLDHPSDDGQDADRQRVREA